VSCEQIQRKFRSERENIMFRRTLLGMVAVAGLLVVGSGSAFANGGWGGHHHHHGGGYGGYRGGYGYGGYGYRPVVVVPPRPIVVAPPVYPGVGCNSGFGYGAGYGPVYGGGYGYGGYGQSVGISTPGFGMYLNR
jgi:hypothetical protein